MRWELVNNPLARVVFTAGVAEVGNVFGDADTGELELGSLFDHIGCDVRVELEEIAFSILEDRVFLVDLLSDEEAGPDTGDSGSQGIRQFATADAGIDGGITKAVVGGSAYGEGVIEIADRGEAVPAGVGGLGVVFVVVEGHHPAGVDAAVALGDTG